MKSDDQYTPPLEVQNIIQQIQLIAQRADSTEDKWDACKQALSTLENLVDKDAIQISEALGIIDQVLAATWLAKKLSEPSGSPPRTPTRVRAPWDKQ